MGGSFLRAQTFRALSLRSDSSPLAGREVTPESETSLPKKIVKVSSSHPVIMNMNIMAVRQAFSDGFLTVFFFGC